MKQLKNADQFGEAIYLARKQANFTQEALAAVCGVGIRFIRELENGKETCQLGKALMVANMLGVQIMLKRRGK